MRRLVPFFAGLLFAVGLGIAGMTVPAKVIAFLDVFGPWDPSLAFVMAGALLVHLPFVQWLRRRRPSANLGPPPARVDLALIAGAATFGIGWGLSGLCPGPGLRFTGQRRWRNLRVRRRLVRRQRPGAPALARTVLSSAGGADRPAARKSGAYCGRPLLLASDTSRNAPVLTS